MHTTPRPSRRPSLHAVLRASARVGLAGIFAAAALIPVSAAATPTMAPQADPCVEHALGGMWWCQHHRHTPLYKEPRPGSVQVGTTGPHVEGFFTCRDDNGGPSGSPVHPTRWLWHAEGGGWLPDGKISSETDPVKPC